MMTITGELPALREPILVEPVDPVAIAPNPGPMGDMYIGAREKYEDGMTLALANPIPGYTYDQLKELYVKEREQQGGAFSDVGFFEKYFTVEPPAEADYQGRPGETVDEYTRRIRPLFIFPNTRQRHFGIRLPYDRSVAGIGRFGEHSFLWDGYHMAHGYRADGEWKKVLNVVDNTEYEIARFGHPLNGSAEFYATRPQPDYFAHMVRMLADAYGEKALIRYLPAMERNHMGYWMDGMEELAAKPLDGKVYEHRTLVRLADGTFVNRYWDDANGPRLESYKEDVEEGELVVAGLKGELRKRRLQKYHKDKRSGATTGWDYSSRWYADGEDPLTINTTDIIPVDLQSLLSYNEETLAMGYEAAAEAGGYYNHFDDRFYTAEECRDRAQKYRGMLEDRVQAINKYNWDPNDKIYRDYNFVEDYQTKVESAAMVYPLYVGIASPEQTEGVADAVEQKLLYDGGIIATTSEKCISTQWDGGERGKNGRSKNVWAPFNWAGVRGFARMGHKIIAAVEKAEAENRQVDSVRLRKLGNRLIGLSARTKKAFMFGVEEVFDEFGLVTEKHRGDEPRTAADGGEYELVKVLAMPAETYRAMIKLDPYDAADHLTKGEYELIA